MLGAIVGDVIGSRFEMTNFFSKDFELFTCDNTFTDDTVCTIAIADALMRDDWDFSFYLRKYCNEVPHAGYGGMFKKWLQDEKMGPYYSWGNGGAMRVGAVPYLAQDKEDVLNWAEATSEVTHNHVDAVRGAQALALSMFLAMEKNTSDEIRSLIQNDFGYDLSPSVSDLQNMKLEFDVSAKGTVPLALICALESSDFEDAIRNAVSIGGDSDTIACMSGALAEILHDGVPEFIKNETYKRIPLQYIEILESVQAAHEGMRDDDSY